MSTIKEIQERKYCDGCKGDCIMFVHDADSCLYELAISKLSCEAGLTDSSKEVFYVQGPKTEYVIDVVKK